MECFYCDGKTLVKETRYYGGCTYRKRICKECKKTFYTLEEYTEDMSEIRRIWSYGKMDYRDRKRNEKINRVM